MDNKTLKLGELLRTSRKNKKLSMKKVGEAIGTATMYISNVETGKTPLAWEKIEAVAKLLDIKLMDLAKANLRESYTYQCYSTVLRRAKQKENTQNVPNLQNDRQESAES